MTTIRGAHRLFLAAGCIAMFALNEPVRAQAEGWYAGVEGAVNVLDDAENRSRTPDSFQPGTERTCSFDLPGVICLGPEAGEPSETMPGQTQVSESRFDDGIALGITIGRRFSSGARPELGISFRENDFDSIMLRSGFGEQDGTTIEDVDGRVRAFGLMGNFWFDIDTGTLLEPYIGAGVGFRQIELGGGGANASDAGDDSDVVFGYQAGAGATIWLSRLLALSLDYRFLAGENPKFKTSERQPLTSEYQAQSFGIGLRYVFSPVDPPDSDGDGVPDYKDRCPGTPAGVTVNESGCPLDSDGDGVPDHRDQCPNTPQGTPVGPDGCPRDSDGDGVLDHLDECPNTPKGMRVGPNGCPLDSDGDGVPDHLDQCPGTPQGVAVMTNGCAAGQAQVLHGVNFQLNNARLTPNAKQLLKLTAQTLKDSPEFSVELQGHTCDLGSESYNLDLSNRRAEAVRAYLVSEGVDAQRMRAKGYGESQPRVPNRDEAHRELNRRVELKVLSR